MRAVILSLFVFSLMPPANADIIVHNDWATGTGAITDRDGNVIASDTYSGPAYFTVDPRVEPVPGTYTDGTAGVARITSQPIRSLPPGWAQLFDASLVTDRGTTGGISLFGRSSLVANWTFSVVGADADFFAWGGQGYSPTGMDLTLTDLTLNEIIFSELILDGQTGYSTRGVLTAGHDYLLFGSMERVQPDAFEGVTRQSFEIGANIIFDDNRSHVRGVSEPGTLALFVVGLFGMGLARRRIITELSGYAQKH